MRAYCSCERNSQNCFQEGDVILMVNGRPTHEMGREVTKWVIGPSGTAVELIVERRGVLVSQLSSASLIADEDTGRVCA